MEYKSKKLISNISIGLEKLGDKRYGAEVEKDLVLSIKNNSINYSNLIYCDTAEIYGLNKSEILIGEISQIVGRDKFHISTKIGLTYKYEKEKIVTYRYFDEYQIKKSLEESCKRLISPPNRIYLHWPHPDNAEITLNCLGKLVIFANQLGIKEIGICNISIKQPLITLEKLRDLGVNTVQERINLLTRKSRFLAKAKRLDFRIVSHSSFAQGILSSSSKEVIEESSGKEFPKFLNTKKYEYEWVNNINSLIKEYAVKLKKNPEEIIVACQKRILGHNSEMIIGVKHKRHIDPLFGRLNSAEIDELNFNQILEELEKYQFEPRLPNHS